MSSVSIVVFLALFLSFIPEMKAQNKAVPEQPQTIASTLQYQPEMPAANSYKIIKNTSGEEVPDSILLKVNLMRRADEKVEWKVNDNIELMIFPVDPEKTRGK